MKLRVLKLLVLGLFAAVALAALGVNRGHAQPQQQGEKTVEQTRKNIQVLKGLPESQLFTVMNFMRDSLGVSCAYCHVHTADDKWVWESDDKPEKITARRMIQMQFDINKGNRAIFGSTGAVSCYTCHRGQTQPALMPSLPQTPPEGGAAGEKPKAESAAALPTAEQIIAKYEQAIGGRAAAEKLKSRVMKGTQTASGDGTSSPVEVDQVAPDKIVAIVTTKGGPVMTGYNGTTGWTKNPRGQRELTGAQLAQLKLAAAFQGDFMFRQMYPGMVVLGREKVGEREAYVVASQVSETRTEKLYFDTETGLLLRMVAVTHTLLAPIPEQTDFEDYREVDGIKLPFTVRQSYVDPWSGWTRKFTEIKHNVPVDETRFNMPPAPAQTPAAK